MSATTTTAVMVTTAEEIPDWWPEKNREEVVDALQCSTCVMLRKNENFRFWQCDTEAEHDLAAWLLKALATP